MDEEIAAVLKKSGDSVAGVWLFIVGILAALVLFISFFAPTVGWGQPSAQQLVSAAAGKDAPTIVYTNDWRNCGGSSGHSGGCFSVRSPHTIYVSPDMRYPFMKYVVLHETGHFEQNKHGEKINECGADAYAKAHGADISASAYKKKCNE
jgi:hypothetical protein